MIRTRRKGKNRIKKQKNLREVDALKKTEKGGWMWAKERNANGGGKGFKKMGYINKQRKGKVRYALNARRLAKKSEKGRKLGKSG
jgi:hypothetical protein